MFYQKVLKPIFFKFDPELMHNLFVWFGEILGKFTIFKKITSFFYGYKGLDISKTIDGITFKAPFILAAGFDYNAKLMNILPEVSFGGEEIGSVTAMPCEGNPKPRMKRLLKSQSILVNKGLRNDGVEAVIRRLKKYRSASSADENSQKFILGISIARTNDQKTSNTEEGIKDFFYSFKRLNEENIGDYYAINISCPNAFGGESFADPKMLSLLLTKFSSIPCKKPVYVKMPINLSWQKFDELLKIIDGFKMIKGVIIGNLNKDYSSLDFREEAPKEYKGGLSGKPCRELSNNLIRKTREVYGKRFTIIGCGGVMSPEDMFDKLKAGADLIQLVTGIIFNGPGLIKKLANYYSKTK
jgi:dihydroorotate dehydrogenase